MFWVMMGVIVMILCTGLIKLRVAIRSNRVEYGAKKVLIEYISPQEGIEYT
jgi:hypothetical protein